MRDFARHQTPRFSAQTEKSVMGVETSPARTMRWKCVPDHRSEQDNHENFLPTVFCPVGHAGVNGEATGAAFFLFLSALGFFFFSRLLLNWPFAISSTLLPVS